MGKAKLTVDEFLESLPEHVRKRPLKIGANMTTPESKAAKLCRFCDCPMKPKGIKKRKYEYDHACGCPYHRHTAHCPHTLDAAIPR